MMSPRAHAASSSACVLVERWTGLVREQPEAAAVIDAAAGTVLSRVELDLRAGAWARDAAPRDARSGQRVAFALRNGVDWWVVFLGLLKRQLIPIPLDSSEPSASQHDLARHGGAAFLVGSDGSLNPIRNAVRPDPFGTCLVKLTSGSTGTPKALVFSHREMLADGEQVCATMDIRSDDRNLAIIPFGHSYGLGNLVVPLLAQGTAAICVSTPLPHAIAADCARWRPTVFPAVPALLRVLTLSDLPAADFSSLRVVISAGSPLPAETARGFYDKYHRLVHNFYGSSETGGIAYDRSGEATLAGRSVGTPLEGVSLRFVRGQRFWVSSRAVVTRKNPNRSPAGHGEHRPADRGVLNDRGEVTLLGRAGRMMKVAGRRIDLAELERSLRSIAGVRDVFAAPHPRRPEELAVVLATELSLEDVRHRLRDALAAWKMPRRVITVPEFPLTSRGKIDTRALKSLLDRDPPASGTAGAADQGNG